MKNVTKEGLPVYALMSVLFVILLTACSAKIPSESDARSVFENKQSRQIKEGSLKIDSFSKTNGQKMNIDGVEAYKVEYNANVTYPKGVRPECVDQKSFTYNCSFAEGFGEGRAKRIGQKETISGQLVFEKTEKGWKGEDGKIY